MPTLDWIGKKKVVNHHLDVPFKVLNKQYTFSADGKAQDSENKIIHGDNLEALKALLPEYEGKIKCIYIDPPYNTGNENWIYNDNVNDPRIKKWLGEIVGKEGEDLSRHDKWLCMMYPRLKLLQKLLSEDGAIFISIDDTEQANLKLICDEIFGIDNFVGMITWESTTQPTNVGNAKYNLQKKVEPIFLYVKNGEKKFLVKTLESENKYPHNGKLGKCRFEIIEKSDAGGYNRETMKFPILGQLPREGKRWQIGKETADELVKNNRIEIVDGIVKKAVYPEDELDKIQFEPFWSHFSAEKYGTAQRGKDLLTKIMGKSIGFDTVKPIGLLEALFSHFPKDSIILDSFAGSGTTAHAILSMNKADSGNRKFILIEMMDYAESITAERVNRVISGYGIDKDKTEGLGGDFNFYELGEPLLVDGLLNEKVDVSNIREYIWFTETHSKLLTNLQTTDNEYFLGKNNDAGYWFYYKKNEETCLNYEFLSTMKTKADQYIIYADVCRLPDSFLKEHNIVFKKIPREIQTF